MHLAEAHIVNFRSLRDVHVRFGAQTALVGGNGAGKSSVLKAIEKFYSTTARLDPDDHFGRDVTVPVEIELTFEGLSEEEAAAFESRVRDGRLVVTRVFDGGGSSGRYFGSVPQNPDFAAIRALPGAREKTAAYRQLKLDDPRYAGLPNVTAAAGVEEAYRAWEADNPGALALMRDDGQFFGFQNASRGALQRHTSFVFIPAVREAALDAADGKASAIGKLLELLVRSAILQRPDFVAFQQEMADRYRTMVSRDNMPELSAFATRLTTDIKSLYRDAEVDLAWRDAADLSVPLPIADVSLSDDGFGGPVDRQGHGLQRAFVFTLLQHLARSTQLPDPTEAPDPRDDAAAVPPVQRAPNLILAIEEPELYQHPTKQRHLATVLRGLSEGTLPGAEGPTQIIFGSHSPMFVSLDRADEIRLVRRMPCGDSAYKQCDLRALDLGIVARKIGSAWGIADGEATAEGLKPRLHILGTELAEGFFANGVVLVEGRSDKAALHAIARLVNVDFEAAGIAVLSAEGKGNLDKPYAIFRELGIPVFLLWDCDGGVRDAHFNLPLLRLARDDAALAEALPATFVGADYAHFEDTLETLIQAEIGADIFTECLAGACSPLGIPAGKKSAKIPRVMQLVLNGARERGAQSATLDALVRAIWLHLTGSPVPGAAHG